MLPHLLGGSGPLKGRVGGGLGMGWAAEAATLLEEWRGVSPGTAGATHTILTV